MTLSAVPHLRDGVSGASAAKTVSVQNERQQGWKTPL